MSDEISDLRLFTQLVSAGSLSAAARSLDTSPAAMSRRLAGLETRLGVRLVARTTRTFELTAEGSVFHDRCLRIITEIEEAEAEVTEGGTVPRGPLRIGVPLEIGRRRIAPIVADFVELYPNVDAHLVLSDAYLDIIDDGLDVCLHIGMPQRQGGVTTKILTSRLIIIAAPAYIERHGMPQTPRDLQSHNCIRLVRGRRYLDAWTFVEDGKERDIRVHGTLSTTSAEVVHDWAITGRGIAMKAAWDVQSDIDSGRLIACLEPFRRAEATLHAVFHDRRHLAPRIRLFIDFVKERLRERPNTPAVKTETDGSAG